MGRSKTPEQIIKQKVRILYKISVERKHVDYMIRMGDHETVQAKKRGESLTDGVTVSTMGRSRRDILNCREQRVRNYIG